MTDSESKPKLRWWRFRRSWLRFSLRTLLVLLTVACLGLGWLANRANQQRHAVNWVNELGGAVAYDYEVGELGSFVLYAKPPGPDWLRDLIGIDYFANVVVIHLAGTQVSDLTPLANLTNLERLDLEGTQVSDLTPLVNLGNLELLDLDRTHVCDLKPLANLTNLKWLDLSGKQVSDLTPLANLTNLNLLYLNKTQVSDLTPLANLKSLKVLSLEGTQVSKEDLDLLQKSLPSLLIQQIKP